MPLVKPYYPVLQRDHPLVRNRRLVGAWMLDDGVYRDLTATRAHGTPTNGPTRRVGRYGRETLFTAASSQYVTCGNPTPLQITDNITISTSYRLTTNVVMQIVAKDKDAGGRAYTLDIQNTGSAAADGVRFYINGGAGGYIVIEGRTPVAGDDRNVVAQYRSSDGFFALYINGALAASATLGAAAIPGATANLTIARREYAGYEGYFDGAIRYVYIWNSILAPGEIARHNADPFAPVRAVRRRAVAKAPSGILVTPTTAALVTTTFAPTVTTPRLCTPTTAALTLTTFAPILGNGYVPTTAALTLTTFAPTVSTPSVCTPTTAALTLTTFAPTVTTALSTATGQTTETDAALAATVTAAAAITTGQTAETDSALGASVATALATATGQTTETDSSLAATVTAAFAASVGRGAETDEALPLLQAQAVECGRAEETDEARGCEVVAQRTATGGGGWWWWEEEERRRKAAEEAAKEAERKQLEAIEALAKRRRMRSRMAVAALLIDDAWL